MRPKGSQTIKAYISSWAKEEGLEVWDFRRQEGDLLENEKSTRFINKCLPVQTETVGHREDFDSQTLPSFPPAQHSQSVFFGDIYGDSSLPVPVVLSKFF